MNEDQNLPDKEGYKEPYKYPIEKWKLLIFGTFIFISIIGILLENFIPLWEQGRAIFAITSVVLLYVLAVVNVHLHEGVHIRISRLFGHEPEVRYNRLHVDGFVTLPNQFINANHNFINLLGPLTSLGFVYSIFLLADIHWTITLVFSILLAVNTGGSGGDIIGAIFDYNLPEGSLVYYPESEEEISYIYEPND